MITPKLLSNRWIWEPFLYGVLQRANMQTKLTSGEYKDIYEYAYDMRLIWRNCCTYNQESADIYKIGKSLSEFFEYQFKEIELLGRIGNWLAI